MTYLNKVSNVTPELRKLSRALKDSAAKVRRDALLNAVADVCAICGGRSAPVELSGPNDAGNFHHNGKLCPASAIHARLHFESNLD